jgi:hypothetical protein
MRVYLSARFERQNEMQLYSEQLRAEGIEVLSAWTEIDSPSSNNFNGIGTQRRALFAMMNLQQLVGSHVLVVFSDAGGKADRLGEKHVDLGVALALGKRLLLVGAAENSYHDLPDVEQFATWPPCFMRILEWRNTDAMTTRQAAAEAGVTTREIAKWIRTGKLLAMKRDGRYVVGRNDLDRARALHRRTAANLTSGSKN